MASGQATTAGRATGFRGRCTATVRTFPSLDSTHLASESDDRDPFIRFDKDDLAALPTRLARLALFFSVHYMSPLRRWEESHPFPRCTLFLWRFLQLGTSFRRCHPKHTLESLLVVFQRKVERLAQGFIGDIVVSRADSAGRDDEVVLVGHTAGGFDAGIVSGVQGVVGTSQRPRFAAPDASGRRRPDDLRNRFELTFPLHRPR